HSFRSGRFSVNVWGWISIHGPSVCWKIEGRFIAENYVNILENIMLPSSEQVYPENDYIFQQDNGPVHTANSVRNFKLISAAMALL
ncbi:unnamed protein product, partial [Callosobruchus maculatus]